MCRSSLLFLLPLLAAGLPQMDQSGRVNELCITIICIELHLIPFLVFNWEIMHWLFTWHYHHHNCNPHYDTLLIALLRSEVIQPIPHHPCCHCNDLHHPLYFCPHDISSGDDGSEEGGLWWRRYNARGGRTVCTAVCSNMNSSEFREAWPTLFVSSLGLISVIWFCLFWV